MGRNFAMAYSGGKDSILALYKLMKQGDTPKVLFTTFNESIQGGNHHSLTKDILNRVADCLGIPIVFFDKSAYEIFQDVYVDFLRELKRYNIEYCAFGDIFLEGSKATNTRFCEQAGLLPLFPLWGMEEQEVFDEFIQVGFKAIIKAVDTRRLCSCILGHSVDKTLIGSLTKPGISICGEHGEYHTFVFDGPIFKRPVSFEIKDTVEHVPYRTLVLQ